MLGWDVCAKNFDIYRAGGNGTIEGLRAWVWARRARGMQDGGEAGKPVRRWVRSRFMESTPTPWLPHYQFPSPPMASRPFLHLLAETMSPMSWMNFSWPKPKNYFPSFSLSALPAPLAWLATNSSWRRLSEHSLLLLYLLLLPEAAALVQSFHDLPVNKAWCL